jgi:hypothetical protein
VTATRLGEADELPHAGSPARELPRTGGRHPWPRAVNEIGRKLARTDPFRFPEGLVFTGNGSPKATLMFAVVGVFPSANAPLVPLHSVG